MESTGVYWSLLDSTWTPWGMVKYCVGHLFMQFALGTKFRSPSSSGLSPSMLPMLIWRLTCWTRSQEELIAPIGGYATSPRQVHQQFLKLFAAAQELVKVHGYAEGLQIYIYMNQEEVNKWIKQHKPSPILHAHEFHFLCTFLHFLDQYSYHFLARHIHTFVHLRFSASYDLWSVLHLVMDHMEPSDGKYDFNYDSFPILNSPYSVLPMSPASNQSPSPSPVFT